MTGLALEAGGDGVDAKRVRASGRSSWAASHLGCKEGEDTLISRPHAPGMPNRSFRRRAPRATRMPPTGAADGSSTAAYHRGERCQAAPNRARWHPPRVDRRHNPRTSARSRSSGRLSSRRRARGARKRRIERPPVGEAVRPAVACRSRRPGLILRRAGARRRARPARRARPTRRLSTTAPSRGRRIEPTCVGAAGRRRRRSRGDGSRPARRSRGRRPCRVVTPRPCPGSGGCGRAAARVEDAALPAAGPSTRRRMPPLAGVRGIAVANDRGGACPYRGS